MSSGHPLNDEDRQPWLEAIAGWIRDHQDSGGVVTSSALKYRYRDVLRSGGDVWFLHLHGDRALLADRMKTRSGHFMPVSLLDSQLADLEQLRPDESGLVADIANTPEEIIATALSALEDRK
jgi:gluconokinase